MSIVLDDNPVAPAVKRDPMRYPGPKYSEETLNRTTRATAALVGGSVPQSAQLSEARRLAEDSRAESRAAVDGITVPEAKMRIANEIAGAEDDEQYNQFHKGLEDQFLKDYSIAEAGKEMNAQAAKTIAAAKASAKKEYAERLSKMALGPGNWQERKAAKERMRKMGEDAQDKEDAQKAAHFDAQDQQRKLNANQRRMDYLKNQRDKAKNDLKGKERRKVVKEMDAKIAAAQTVEEKQEIRGKYEKILSGEAPTTEAATAIQAAEQAADIDYTQNVIGGNVSSHEGLATYMAADPTIKNLQGAADEVRAHIAKHGHSPKTRAAIERIQTRVEARMPMVEKAHRAKITKAAGELHAKAMKEKNVEVRRATLAEYNKKAAVGMAAAQKALAGGDLDGALKAATDNLEIYPESDSAASMRTVIATVRREKKDLEDDARADAKTRATDAVTRKKERIKGHVEAVSPAHNKTKRAYMTAKVEYSRALGSIEALDAVEPSKRTEHHKKQRAKYQTIMEAQKWEMEIQEDEMNWQAQYIGDLEGDQPVSNDTIERLVEPLIRLRQDKTPLGPFYRSAYERLAQYQMNELAKVVTQRIKDKAASGEE